MMLLGCRLKRMDDEANVKVVAGSQVAVFQLTLSDKAARSSKRPSVILRGDVGAVEVFQTLLHDRNAVV